MGLKEILDDISGESELQRGESLNAAIIDSDKRIVEAIEEIERKKLEEQKILAGELKRKRIKLTAKAELDSYREKQTLEVGLITRVLNEAFDELVKHLKGSREAYLGFLKKLVRASIDLIGSKPVGISLSKDDADMFGELEKEFGRGEITLRENVKISGGVICSAGGSYVDNSLENIFEKKRPEFVKMISEELN